jgi:hypothetical protein
MRVRVQLAELKRKGPKKASLTWHQMPHNSQCETSFSKRSPKRMKWPVSQSTCHQNDRVDGSVKAEPYERWQNKSQCHAY